MTPDEQAQLRAKVKARVEILKLVYGVIRDRGSAGIPSGHLYAALMAQMDLDTYNSLIRTLKECKLITETNYLLQAVPDEALDKKT